MSQDMNDLEGLLVARRVPENMMEIYGKQQSNGLCLNKSEIPHHVLKRFVFCTVAFKLKES